MNIITLIIDISKKYQTIHSNILIFNLTYVLISPVHINY